MTYYLAHKRYLAVCVASLVAAFAFSVDLERNVVGAEESSNNSSEDWFASEAGTRRTLTIEGVEYVFHLCPSGTYKLGRAEYEPHYWYDNEPDRKATITKSFYALETEVTQKMWSSVMGEDPSYFKGDDLPVERVSFDDCQEYVRKLNELGVAPSGWRFSLPTEAQWEVAARAGSMTPYPWGNALNGDKANCDGDAPYGADAKGKLRATTVPVRSFEPNAWGLYQTSGNVWEWTREPYSDYPPHEAVDPFSRDRSYFGSLAVRGGGWMSNAWHCRSAMRYPGVPTSRSAVVGLRLFLVQEWTE